MDNLLKSSLHCFFYDIIIYFIIFVSRWNFFHYKVLYFIIFFAYCFIYHVVLNFIYFDLVHNTLQCGNYKYLKIKYIFSGRCYFQEF